MGSLKKLPSSLFLKAIPLKVSAPFHCALMTPAAARLKNWVLENKHIYFQDLSKAKRNTIPVLSTCTLEYVDLASASDFADYVERQMVDPVYWYGAIKQASFSNILSLKAAKILEGQGSLEAVPVFGEIGSATLQSFTRLDFPQCQFHSFIETKF